MRRQVPDVVVNEAVLHVLREDRRVERFAQQILLADVVRGALELLAQILGRLVEVVGLHAEPGPALQRFDAPRLQNVRPQRLGEAARRRAQAALEVVHDTIGQLAHPGLRVHLVLPELVRDHELRQVAHHLRGGRHFRNVA